MPKSRALFHELLILTKPFVHSTSTLFTARWFVLKDLEGAGPELFPSELKQLLRRRK